MKKLIFHAQVIGLTALFPLVVILELNHIQGRSAESISPAGIKKETQKTEVYLPGKVQAQKFSGVLVNLETLFIKHAF
jgi:hypothetical protein